MVRNVTTALVATLVLGSAGIASARAPSIEHYDGWTYPQSKEPYCYLPSWPCQQTPREITHGMLLAQPAGDLSRRARTQLFRRIV